MFKDDERFPQLNEKVEGNDYANNPYPHAVLVGSMISRSKFTPSL